MRRRTPVLSVTIGAARREVKPRTTLSQPIDTGVPGDRFVLSVWAVAELKDCPMCGESMRVSERETRDRLPGEQAATVRRVREWVCPECDYFEEAEAGEG